MKNNKVVAELDIQRGLETGPSDQDLQQWVDAVLDFEQHDDAEMTIRIVDNDESAELNGQYRNKQGPTNVLSFPFECPPEVELNLLGDLVICAPVVAREASEQNKDEQAHWAHMVVHGCLHLLGYDHIDPADAEVMEGREKQILSNMGYPDPYREIEEQ